ncbi:hypothetical protein ACB098_04G065100 [Castanea mollissima]
MDLVKLAIQDPLWSLKSPLAAARPGFPLAKPSVLSLKKLTRGGVQLMWVMLFLVGALFVGIRCHMLWARDFARLEIAWAEKGVCSMMNLLRAVQMHQAVSGEMMCHGKVLWSGVVSVGEEMNLSQLGRSRVKKLGGRAGCEEFCQMIKV